MNPSAISRRHFLSLLPPALLAACSEEPATPEPRLPKVKYRVTGTTHFTTDLVGQIGGDAVEPLCFLPPGVSPHGFVPSGPDITRLHTSDAVITHGLGLENPWPVDFDALVKSGLRIWSATASIPPARILRPSGADGPPDPHVWTHPELATLMVDAVETALKDFKPELAGYFARRAHRLRVELQRAIEFLAPKFRDFKATDRFLLTSHDTMQYFASGFGLEARALAPPDGKVPDTIPPDLTDWIRSNNVRSLFRESFTDALSMRRMLYDLKVNPDHVIYSLTLPPEGTKTLVSYKNYDASRATGSLHYDGDLIQSTLEVD